MNRKNLVDEFINRFPEYKAQADEELADWTDEPVPPHWFFAVVVDPALVEELTRENNPELLKRFFEFFEEMANSKDEEVVDALGTMTLERICDDELTEKALKYMGLKTKKAFDIVYRQEIGELSLIDMLQ